MNLKAFCGAAVTALTFIGCIWPASASAQDEGDSPDHVALGVAAMIYHSPFEGEDETILPIPLVSIRQGPLYVNGIEGGLDFKPRKSGPLRPSLQLFVAARAIAGESREKITADAGGRIALESELGSISLSYQHDITGTFDGGEAIGRYEHAIGLGSFTITPAVQVNWLDRKTANHMYGISEKQHHKMVEDGHDVVLQPYIVTEKALNLGGDLSVSTVVGERFLLLGTLSGTYFGRSIRRNPNLRDDWEAQALIGAAYLF